VRGGARPCAAPGGPVQPSRRALNLLSVTFADSGSGAAQVAWTLFTGYRRHGHRSWLAVNQMRRRDPDLRYLHGLPDRPARNPAAPPPRTPAERLKARQAGEDSLDYPGTWDLLDLVDRPVDILHLHAFAGGYFDLRALPWLSQRCRVVITVHDEWAFTGHCMYSFDCRRWEAGCGECPDLGIPHTLAADDSAANLARKAEIYRCSRYWVATPCRWMEERVRRSILGARAVEIRTVSQGVDLSLFSPGDRAQARDRLGLPQDRIIVGMVAANLRSSPFKDLENALAALRLVGAEAPALPLLVLAVGAEGPPQTIGTVEVRPVGIVTDPDRLAAHYQAMDLFLHPARQENMPVVFAEAQACGIPVVATAVGGTAEAVSSLWPLPGGGVEVATESDATGILVPPGAPRPLADALLRLAGEPALRRRLGANAAARAASLFDADATIAAYLDWFGEIADE